MSTHNLDIGRVFTMLLIGVSSLLVSWSSVCATDLPGGSYTEWTQDREIFVPMRDGVRLSTTVVRPRGATGKLPTILVRSPYDGTSSLFGTWLWLDSYVRHGYAVVLQDQRGRGFSEGTQKNLMEGAGADGADTIAWIRGQAWSNGKVGAIGCSITGMEQWPVANNNSRELSAMIPMASGPAVGKLPDNETRAAFYRGGVPRLSMFASWFSVTDNNERVVLPANSTQEERIRLRNTYSLWGKDFFNRQTPDVSRFLHLPSGRLLRDVGAALSPFDSYITWTPEDSGWNAVELVNTGYKSRTPALLVNTWHDHSAGETTRLFKYLQDASTPNQYLIMGAGPHCSQADNSDEKLTDFKFGDLEVGDARYGGIGRSYAQLFLAWYDHWLKGEQNNVTAMPKVQLFVMGSGWISGDQWPLKETRFTKYYLDSVQATGVVTKSGVLSLHPSVTEGADRYVYDPGAPTPSLGGGAWEEETPARDQRPVEARKDVLTYTTHVLERPTTIVGPIEVVLYVSSSAKDTDFMVKLVDVYPDGKAINLDDDAFRARYREGFDKKVLMQAGGIYRIVLPNMVTAVRFAKGHRIRLDIASSNFPEYERNLNTGGNNFDEVSWVSAENTVHHGPRYPSYVLLPELPE